MVSVLLATLGLGLKAAPAAMADPTIGLRAANESTEVKRPPGRAAWINPGIYVVAQDGPFELRATRPASGGPATLTRVLPGGATQELDPALIEGMGALKTFFMIRIENASGKVVKRKAMNFCPNSWEPERVNDSGPSSVTYPYFCSDGPLTRGMVWGIDQGWGTSAFDFGLRLKAPKGRYTMRTNITKRFVEALEIPPELASVTTTLKLVNSKRGGCHHCGHSGGVAARQQQLSADVPTIPNPDPAILPDLAALPAFGMRVTNGDRQFLRFGANVWVAGASSLHVEGFRRPSEDLMDAYQYFYESGEIIGKAPVGTFEYDNRRGHTHWHFRQFAGYRLVDAASDEVVKSTKEAFCLVPTNAIDLTLPGAVYRPDEIGFGGSSCGQESSLWVREVLPLGWGDTYIQSRPGQSFNITNVPNGTYYVEVEANPGGLLHDGDPTNNVERRKVIIKGKKGNRHVTVPPLSD